MFSGARGNQICYVYHVKNCGNGFEYVWENEICKKDSSRGKNERKTVVSIWDVVRKYNHKCNLSLMSRVEKIIISNHFFVKNLFDSIYKNIIIGQT